MASWRSRLCRDALAECPGEPNLLSLLGAALNRQGRAAEAEPELRRALAEEPGYAKAHEELGRSLLQLGRSDEAIDSLQKALALDPKLQGAQLTLIHALSESGRALEADGAMQTFLRADPAREVIAQAAAHQRAGRLEQAEAAYREILRRDPRNIEALRLLALIAMQTEHYGQAEQLLARAVELAPDFLDAWVDLSRAQLEQLHLPAARASIARAEQLNPRSASVQVHMANVQSRSGHYAEAIGAFRRALELNTQSTAACLGLGNTLKTIGRQAEAIDAYRRAIELRPDLSEAWWSLSNLKTFRFDDADVETMQRQLESPALTDEARAQFSFALGKALEDRGEYARAFEQYDRGNRTRRKLESYDPVQTEVINERIRAVFDADFMARHAGSGDADPSPIFIVGLPRSGSTLIEQILASHSHVDATHELPEVGRLILQINRESRSKATYPEAVRDFDREAWAKLGRSYIEATRQYRRDAPRFLDKNPNNFASIGLHVSCTAKCAVHQRAAASARHLPLLLQAALCEGPAVHLRPRRDRRVLPRIRPDDGALERGPARSRTGRAIRRCHRGPAGPGAPDAGILRAFVGGRLPALPRDRARDPHRELGAGAPPDL